MKIAALIIVLFGLLTAIYGLAAVVPKYKDANSEWTSSPAGPRHEKLGEKRDELRSRSQSYAMTIIGTGAVALILTIIGRKRPKPATGLLIALSIACFAAFGVMQAWGNIF